MTKRKYAYYTSTYNSNRLCAQLWRHKFPVILTQKDKIAAADAYCTVVVEKDEGAGTLNHTQLPTKISTAAAAAQYCCALGSVRASHNRRYPRVYK